MQNSVKLTGTTVVALIAIALGAACSSEAGGGGSDEATGTATVALQTVPADVSCLRLTAAGSRTVTKSFDVMTPGASVESMTELPVGAVAFSATAFASGCSGVTAASVPTWVTDAPVTATVNAKSPVTVSLTLTHNGQATVGVDFPADDAGPTCPAPSTMCGSACANLNADPANCGACGQACVGMTPTCTNGTCVASCAAPNILCGSACVNPSSDVNHCGACVNVCMPGSACVSGVCATAAMPSCSDGIKNGNETDVDCGGSCKQCVSGKVCATNNDCVSGFCLCPMGGCMTGICK